MLTYITGDIFTSQMQVLVNPVNTVGVMGKGLAKQFKVRFPNMFDNYKLACDNHDIVIGQLHLYQDEEKLILNIPTKTDWRGKSKLTDVEIGLKRFLEIYEAEAIQAIAFPMLGCGLGGLDWESEVRPLMEHYLQDLNIPVEIYIQG